MTRLVALSLVSALAAACTGSVDGSHVTPGDDVDAGTADAPATDAPAAPGSGTLARAQLWVTAEVPYCQAANHERDYDTSCSTTCDRPDNADWDPYRSDCSGFVSWAWALPAPGRTTADFAPFTTDITYTIAGADLRPGDALNNSDHIVLFEAWTEVGKTAKFLEEPGCSSDTPYAHEFTADVTIDGDSVDVVYHGTFTAIRYDAAP